MTTHTDTIVELPATGLVVVTGPNGGGKSSIVEAPCLAIFGRTLRDKAVWCPETGYLASPRHTAPTCSVEATVDGVAYTRTQRGSTGTITWDGGDTYESRREASATLAERFGDWETWRRAYVLSSSDAAAFTQASPAERMRMLEQLAGVDRFDAAAKAGKEREKLARADAARHAAEAAQLRARASSLRSWLEYVPPEPTPPARPEQPPMDDDAQLRADLADLSADAADAQRAAREAHAQIAQAEQRLGQLQAEQRELARQLAQLAGQHCPTCGQQVDDPGLAERTRAAAARAAAEADQAAAARAAAQIAQAGAQGVLDATRRAEQPLRDQLAALAGQRAAAATASRAYEAALVGYQRARAQYEQHAASQASWRSELADVEAQLAAAEAAQAEATLRAETAAAAVSVLGPRGPRAAMLADQVAALEAATNAWLAQICATRDKVPQVRLATTKETARGQRPSVELAVDGLSHSQGYAGCSGGERRRIDVAFMLALSQIAEAATGASGGTLWGDEAFDALDAEGREACGALLAEMARDRCVVVIAHEAAEQLAPYAALRLHVEGGRVVRQ